MLSVFLPARAAALHGWAGYADFQGGALRSAHIAARLERIGWALAGDRTLSSIRLGELAVEAAEAMEWELAAWWATSASRPITRV